MTSCTYLFYEDTFQLDYFTSQSLTAAINHFGVHFSNGIVCDASWIDQQELLWIIQEYFLSMTLKRMLAISYRKVSISDCASSCPTYSFFMKIHSFSHDSNLCFLILPPSSMKTRTPWIIQGVAEKYFGSSKVLLTTVINGNTLSSWVLLRSTLQPKRYTSYPLTCV